MAGTLTADQVARYKEEGVLHPIPVLPSEEVARFRGEFDRLLHALGGRPKATDLHQLHLNFPWAHELATHPAVLDSVESLLGPDLLVWATSVFAKYPRDESFVSWHQDGTYWGLSSNQVASAWIALSQSTTENGCMRVVPGSHHMAIQPHRDTYAEGNLLSRGQEVAVDVDEADAADVVLAPGEMSVHDIKIVHGSRPNPSPHVRYGYAVRFIIPTVRQAGEAQPVILARGHDTHEHFEKVQKPVEPVDYTATVHAHAQSARRHMKAVLSTRGAYEGIAGDDGPTP